ncbi:MAG: hypothetical protein KJO38_03475, partial [Gammaproteobacteria bacterium]|nr:hypothetical protein [Gammaproteobacteria bacterium]
MTEGARARPRRVRVAPLRVEYETSPLPISAWLLIAGLSLLLLGAFQFVPDRVSITSLKHPVPIRRQEGNSILRQDDRAFIINRVIRGEALDADYLVMGSSAAREATYDSDGLQGAVEAECGARPAFVELTTPGAGPLEALFLISRNGLKAHQTVLLVISPGNLHVTASTG